MSRLASTHRLPATFARLAWLVGTVAAASAAYARPRPAWAKQPPACATRITQLEARYRRADARPDTSGFLPVTAQFEPPSLAGGNAPGAIIAPGAITMIVEVASSGVLVDGRPLDAAGPDHKKIAAALVREELDSRVRWKTLRAGQAAPPAKLGIWFDRRGKAADAVSLLKDVSGKFEVAVLGLAAPEADERDSKDPPASVRKRLAEIRAMTDLLQKSKLIASARRDALAGCAQHEKIPDSLDATAPDAEASFHRLIVKAVGSCGCVGVDFDLLEAVTLPGPDSRTVLARPLRLRDGAAARVTLPGAADVQQLVDRLPASGSFSVRWRGGEGGQGASPDGT